MTLLSALVPALLCIAPAVAPEGESRLELKPEVLKVAGGGEITIERGMLTVPVVRADPSSREIQIEVVRFPAAEGVPADRPPIVELHGGPGWGGLGPTSELGGMYERDFRKYTAVADYIVVGQRGIGSSTDTPCEGWSVPADVELTQEEEDAKLVEACVKCKRRWEGEGYDLSGFNVIEAAADVDDVRRHLGYEQVVLWGGSFGSHWSMAVMRYFPDGVARAVLTGMEGPDHTYDMPSGVLGALERIAEEAEASPALKAHIPEGGLVKALTTLIDSFEQDPFEVDVKNPFTGRVEPLLLNDDVFRGAALGYSGRVNSRRGVATWPADVIAMYGGDFDGVAQAYANENSGPSGDGLPTASFFMLDCGSGITAARAEILKNDPAARIVGELSRFYFTACPAWETDLGDDFRTGFATDIPTVIVHGTWDVSTPFDNALELLDSFSNGLFVPVAGGTHGALSEAAAHDPEFAAALFAFVADGDVSGIPGEVRLPPIRWSPAR
jgi:pimeloyl-ACP methyl ester carboxylesterase